MTVKEIDQEIERLRSLRKEAVENRQDRQEFLSFSWLKGLKVNFRENSFGPYGSYEFILTGVFPKDFDSMLSGSEVLTVKGDSKNYMENIVLTKDSWEFKGLFKIYTCNAKLFVDFIREYGLKVEVDSLFDKKLAVYNSINSLKK